MDKYKNLEMGLNKVLIKLEKFNDSLTLANGTKLALDYKFRPEVHTQVVGYVAKTPESLYFNPTDLENSMEWSTSMDLQVGDKVYIQYLEVILALADRYDYAPSYPNPRWLIIDEEMHIIVDYSTIYFAIRRRTTEYERGVRLPWERIIMLNGFCIASPIKVDLSHYNFKLLEEVKDSNRFGEMVVPGKPIKGFVDEVFMDCGTISIGDIFLFEYYANIRVEYTIHQSFTKGKDYFVVQRNWIYSKMSQEFKQLIINSKIK